MQDLEKFLHNAQTDGVLLVCTDEKHLNAVRQKIYRTLRKASKESPKIAEAWGKLEMVRKGVTLTIRAKGTAQGLLTELENLAAKPVSENSLPGKYT